MTCIIIYDLIISVSQLPSTVKRWKPENFVCTLALLANSFLYKSNLEKIFNLKIWAPSIPSKQLWISIASVSASPHQLWWLVLCFDLTELWGPQIFHQKCFSVCLWDCFFVCEIDIWMVRVSKMDYSPQCGWLSSNQLKSKKKILTFLQVEGEGNPSCLLLAALAWLLSWGIVLFLVLFKLRIFFRIVLGL